MNNIQIKRDSQLKLKVVRIRGDQAHFNGAIKWVNMCGFMVYVLGYSWPKVLSQRRRWWTHDRGGRRVWPKVPCSLRSSTATWREFRTMGKRTVERTRKEARWEGTEERIPLKVERGERKMKIQRWEKERGEKTD